jgi:diguanylate cyclase
MVEDKGIPSTVVQDPEVAHGEALGWNKIIDSAVETAGKDHLTGLIQRKQFESAVRREMKAGRRLKSPVTLALLDVDNFKTYNDVHGHNEGDVALKTIADLMKELAREVDVVARWGGEEFVMLYPGTDIEGGEKAAERFRALVEERLTKEKGLKRDITVSMGIAEWDGEEDIESLVRGADTAMYFAKEKGRNRVAERQLDGTIALLSKE